MARRKKSLVAARGFTLPEVLVAAVVLGAAMTVFVQMLSAMAARDREAARRTTALAEAGNALERLTAMPWNELTPELAAQASLSPAAAEHLPGGELQASIESLESQPPARRIAVEVRWKDRRGRPATPVKLMAWVHRAMAGDEE